MCDYDSFFTRQCRMWLRMRRGVDPSSDRIWLASVDPTTVNIVNSANSNKSKHMLLYIHTCTVRGMKLRKISYVASFESVPWPQSLRQVWKNCVELFHTWLCINNVHTYQYHGSMYPMRQECGFSESVQPKDRRRPQMMDCGQGS